MKKLLLVILLTAISTHAMAGWTLVAKSTDDSPNFYFIDKRTIKREGSKVSAWTLTNYATPQDFSGRFYLSIKAKSFYDCKDETEKVLSMVWYEESDGNGKVIDSFHPKANEVETRVIVPDTIGDMLMKAACGKK